MGSSDKTPSSLRGPKSGTFRDKPAVAQHIASEDESQLKDSIKDYDWSQLESNYMQVMEHHEKSEEELRNHIAKLLQVLCERNSTHGRF